MYHNLPAECRRGSLSGSKEKISKRLSYVLRHRPDSIGLRLDQQGYVEVELLLSALARHGDELTIEQLNELVLTNDKKRFSFDPTGSRIRANQGHSINIDLNYDQKSPPPILYHGTASRFVPSIRQRGLLKGQRHHVHLTESRDTAMSVGSRYGEPVILIVRADQMVANGSRFFLSENQVWLTECVPPNHIEFP